MTIAGFDPEFRDLPHFIYAITAKIWEGRQVHAIRDYYTKDCPLRSPGGLCLGSEGVVAATKATLAEFPDRRLLGEDVVWCGDDQNGYLSSHRILSTATHAGNGLYGLATNKKVCYRVIADCWCKANQVHEEWLVRDQGAIARQLDMSVRQLAQQQVDAGLDIWFTPAVDVPSAYKPVLATDEDAVRYVELWNAIWCDANLAVIPANYHHAVSLAGPSGMNWVGHEGIYRFHLGYLASIAEPKLKVLDLTATDGPGGKTIAMRWEITGNCSGLGVFHGGLREAEMYVMGISHARYVGGKIEAEWVVVDEVSVWKQVLPPVGAQN